MFSNDLDDYINVGRREWITYDKSLCVLLTNLHWDDGKAKVKLA